MIICVTDLQKVWLLYISRYSGCYVNLTSYVLKLSSLRHFDFASVMLFGNLPKTRGEAWFAFIVLLGFFRVLVSVFALLVPIMYNRWSSKKWLYLCNET